MDPKKKTEYIPSGIQTWLAEKSPINGGFNGKIVEQNEGFTIDMFGPRLNLSLCLFLHKEP